MNYLDGSKLVDGRLGGTTQRWHTHWMAGWHTDSDLDGSILVDGSRLGGTTGRWHTLDGTQISDLDCSRLVDGSRLGGTTQRWHTHTGWLDGTQISDLVG